MGSVSDLTHLLYCGVMSASEVAGVKFEYSLQQFANRLTPESLNQWTDTLKENKDEIPEELQGESEEGKKKAEY